MEGGKEKSKSSKVFLIEILRYRPFQVVVQDLQGVFHLLGVYLFFTAFATKLHFFLGIFLHFIDTLIFEKAVC